MAWRQPGGRSGALRAEPARCSRSPRPPPAAPWRWDGDLQGRLGARRLSPRDSWDAMRGPQRAARTSVPAFGFRVAHAVVVSGARVSDPPSRASGGSRGGSSGPRGPGTDANGQPSSAPRGGGHRAPGRGSPRSRARVGHVGSARTAGIRSGSCWNSRKRRDGSSNSDPRKLATSGATEGQR